MLVSRRTSPFFGIDLLTTLFDGALDIVGFFVRQGSVRSSKDRDTLLPVRGMQTANKLRRPLKVRGWKVLEFLVDGLGSNHNRYVITRRSTSPSTGGVK